jgi:hypothetical protein
MPLPTRLSSLDPQLVSGKKEENIFKNPLFDWFCALSG